MLAANGLMAESSDLFAQLDSMASAEPLSAEDDLILRMEAISKVRTRKGGAKEKKEKRKISMSAAKPAKVPATSFSTTLAVSCRSGQCVAASCQAIGKLRSNAKSAMRISMPGSVSCLLSLHASSAQPSAIPTAVCVRSLSYGQLLRPWTLKLRQPVL